MKIYLAATAPGNEQQRGMLEIPRRLLSYFLIKFKIMENDKVFFNIKRWK